MLYILQYTWMQRPSALKKGVYLKKPGADLASELKATSQIPSASHAQHFAARCPPISVHIGHIRPTIGLIGVLPPYGGPTSGGVEGWQILSGYVREDIYLYTQVKCFDFNSMGKSVAPMTGSFDPEQRRSHISLPDPTLWVDDSLISYFIPDAIWCALHVPPITRSNGLNNRHAAWSPII